MLSIFSCVCWPSIYLWINVYLNLCQCFDWVFGVFLVLSCMSYLYIWKGGCFLIYLFIFGCWVFVAAYGLSLVGVSVLVVVAFLVLENRL